jgi:hypothetical protein
LITRHCAREGPDANTGFVFVSGMNTARVRVLFCSLVVSAGHTV